MPCTERHTSTGAALAAADPGGDRLPRRLVLGLSAALPLAWLGGCAQAPRPTPGPAPAAGKGPAPAPAPGLPGTAATAAAPAAAPVPAQPAQPAPVAQVAPVTPTPAGPAAQAPVPANSGPRPRQPRYVRLPEPATPRSQAALQAQFARRLMQAHPDGTYSGPAPARLFAIPVLEVDLHGDGSVRAIKVLRRPRTGDEATRLAIEAVRRAAPYGNVSRLPKPWRVVETFLFDDDLRFKPRTLDLD